jgi:hypothetical protein
MKNFLRSLILLLLIPTCVLKGQSKNPAKCMRPFPHHTPAIATRLGTAPISDQQVVAFYENYKDKKKYFRKDKGGRFFINNDETDGDQKENLTTSEANGYGMIIEALMAGHDPDAHVQFDGLYAFAMHHPSKKSALLMRWRVKRDTIDKDEKESDSAIDGDLDMAYALLLAEKQWGKTKQFDYGALARKTLNVILKLEVDTKGLKLLRGNAGGSAPGSWAYNTIRLSDFMPAHFRAFYQCTGRKIWMDMLLRYHRIYNRVQDQLSPQYHLFPEYLIVNGENFQLIPDNIPYKRLDEEGIIDGHGSKHDKDNQHGRIYGFNSCRVPWRLMTDYVVNGDPWALECVQKIGAGMRLYTGSDACKLTEVSPLTATGTAAQRERKLDKASQNHSADLNVIAPLYLAALFDKGQTEWQKSLSDQLLNDHPMPCKINDGNADRKYYENTLRLLCLLLASNNYWSPGV